MFRRFAALAAGVAVCALAPMAHAGIYSDDLAKCLVMSSSAEDQETLVDWVFVAISAHPAVQPYAKAPDAQRDEVNRKGAKLFERLLTSDCRKETIAALKYEGSGAMETSFGVLGQVAMRNLMNNDKVQQSINALGADVDQSKLEALLKEAGLSSGGSSAPPAPK